MKGSPLGFVVLLLFLALALPAIGFAFDDATHHVDVENEAITLEQDEPVEVDPEHDVETYSQTVTLTHEDEELTETEDYEWDAENGTVTALQSNLDNEVASINYSYEHYTEETQATKEIVEQLAGPWMLGLVLIMGVALMWSWLDFGGNFGGGR